MRFTVPYRIWMAVALCTLAAHGGEPRIEVGTTTSTPRAGEPFSIAYTLHWPDSDSAYVYVPKALPTLDWGEWRLGDASALVVEGNPCVEVNFEITTSDSGDFDIPPIEFAYLEDSESLDAEAAHVVHSDPVPITIRSATAVPPPPMLIGGAAAAAMACGGCIWLVLRKSRRTVAAPQKTLAEQVQLSLHAAQRHRLDANFYAYYQELTRVAEWTARDDAKLLANLRTRTQTVGYGGARPTDDELNGDQRAIERAVARWKEKSEA